MKGKTIVYLYGPATSVINVDIGRRDKYKGTETNVGREGRKRQL